MTRHCCDCGREIINCNGFVNAGDYLEAMDGKREWSQVRERCGLCALRLERFVDGQNATKNSSSTNR